MHSDFTMVICAHIPPGWWDKDTFFDGAHTCRVVPESKNSSQKRQKKISFRFMVYGHRCINTVYMLGGTAKWQGS